jgi:hypothetical protein
LLFCKSQFDIQAAHKGGIECLHWLLESGADPNITDYSASTPTHLAATKGQIHCVNCLVQHGATLSLLNARGDDILGAAKRQGHPVAVHKAIDGKVKCPLCEKERRKHIRELKRKPTAVEANINNARRSVFEINEATVGYTQKKDSRAKAGQPTKTPKKPEMAALLPRREMAAKYFGEQFTDFA